MAKKLAQYTPGVIDSSAIGYRYYFSRQGKRKFYLEGGAYHFESSAPDNNFNCNVDFFNFMCQKNITDLSLFYELMRPVRGDAVFVGAGMRLYTLDWFYADVSIRESASIDKNTTGRMIGVGIGFEF